MGEVHSRNLVKNQGRDFMIEFLKFGASWVLPPGIFFLLFLFLAYCCKKRRQARLASAITIVTLLFYLSSTSYIGGMLIGRMEDVYNVPSSLPNSDVIVVLGGGATSDNPDVNGTGTLCSIPASRLLTAVRLQKKLDVPILVSGGQIYEDSGREADIARRILKELGVPENMIILENKSLNTTQNAQYSINILKARNYKRPLLVTSAFHMERAVVNFAKFGVEVIPYPCDYMVNKEKVFHYNKLAPSSQALEFTAMYMQENLRTFVTKYFE